jgi:hypothetical protein
MTTNKPKKIFYLQDICWTPDDTVEEKANKEIYFIENVVGIQLYEYQKEFIKKYMQQLTNNN